MPLPIPIDCQISPTVNMYCDLFENLMEQLMFKNGTGLENVAARMFKTNQVENLLPL